MSIVARVVQSRTEPPVDMQFAYPLSVGDTFALRENGEVFLCTVSSVVHFPTLDGTDAHPMVGYGINKKKAEDPKFWSWETLRDIALDLAKLK
jgi:hypothetical protein